MKRLKYFLLILLLPCIMHGQDTKNLTLMTFNTHHCQGTDNVVDYTRVSNIIKAQNPNVVALEELDSMTTRTSKVYQLDKLAQLTGMYATYGPAISFQGGKYGIGILSKEKPVSVKHIALPGSEARTLLVCEFTDYVYAATHLALEQKNRNTSVDLIRQEAATWTKPFFVAGDFNALPSSSEMATFRVYFKVLNDTSKYTYSSTSPTECIDYIASFKLKNTNTVVSTKVIDNAYASDHKAVVANINLQIATGIGTVTQDKDKSDVYNLQGMKMTAKEENLDKGIYIVNRKKFLVN